jgi:hypothetical protein
MNVNRKIDLSQRDLDLLSIIVFTCFQMHMSVSESDSEILSDSYQAANSLVRKEEEEGKTDGQSDVSCDVTNAANIKNKTTNANLQGDKIK